MSAETSSRNTHSQLLQTPFNSFTLQFSSNSHLQFSFQPTQLPSQPLQPTNFDHSLRIAPYFIEPGVRGGAISKPTSSSDPSIPIGPALHVVRLSGLGFSQTPVWSAHAAHVWPLAGGCGAATAFVQPNVGILTQKARVRVDGGTLWPAKRG